ncbi:MAG: hypothetical protein US50_C0036G0003 [Candidatus Nomurabacteria bacterium GW2011_GWB1_37_5]|uniref:Nucleotide-diphospho-sugar transferase domain-containing protein n=1 Tax=Candidatus Nomurabacteria bacterium GW2011_GWB1_37_5 TaxID=1618742 RepID=A0A0G0GUW9_9BACT|nr:MAG: hypothetical protein US50_C0036G0003 [Candidatus Nomurabacteria bacterium GW2011_GWB1_37_5]
MIIFFKKYFNRHTFPIIKFYLFHPIILLTNRLIILGLIIKKIINNDVNFNEKIKSNIPIDIVLCAIDKDYDVLVFAIDSIRKYIKHPIGNIYLVCPLSKKIEKISKTKKCILLDENKVLPITKKDINYFVNGQDRSGWLYQQLLKFGIDKFVENEYFLITDADTIYCRPQVFVYSNKVLLPVSGQLCHLPYLAMINRLIGYKIKPTINFVIHHSLFEKTKINILKQYIEKINKKKWYQAIIDNIDPREGSSFSEYETYGQFMLLMYRNDFLIEYAYNRGYGRKQIADIKAITVKNKLKHKNISFHSYDI